MKFSAHHCIASYFELTLANGVAELLPFGHARHFPLAFAVASKKISAGELNFFNSVLHKNFDPQNFIAPESCTAELSKVHASVVILNTLDNCFGHSLLKLLFAVQYMERHKQHDFLLIVPRALRHFLKQSAGVNILCVNLSFSKLEACPVLNREIEKITGAYSEVLLEGTETYDSFEPQLIRDHLDLFGGAAPEEGRNAIIFYYRADYFRKWAGNAQRKRIIQLFEFLKGFFSEEIGFYVLGDQDNSKFPAWIHDERTAAFSAEVDFKYNRLLASAILCVGLTGSHLLFPSLLSECTVHLHPSHKYKNMAEDVIAVDSASGPIINTYTHLYYFGNHNCSDLAPGKLATLILFHYQGLIEKKYKLLEKANIGQNEWILEKYPFFKIREVSAYRQAFNARQGKKNRLRFHLDKWMGRISKPLTWG